MLTHEFIEIPTANGFYAFGPTTRDARGQRLEHSSRQSWYRWLDHEFGFHFKYHQVHRYWERVMLLAGGGPFAGHAGQHAIFRRVADALHRGELQVLYRDPPPPPPEPGPAPPPAIPRVQSPPGIRSERRPHVSSTPALLDVVADPLAPSVDALQRQGDPVAPVTGEEVLFLDDFTLATSLPLTWRRGYRSGHCERDLGLGPGWFVPALQRIWQDAEATWLLDDQARAIRLPMLARGQAAAHAGAGLRLARLADDSLVLSGPDGVDQRFYPDGSGCWRPGLHGPWRYRYDRHDRLIRLEFVPGLDGEVEAHLALCYDGDGRHPHRLDWHRDGQFHTLARYGYDSAGHLIAATSAAGTERYGYRDGLLVRRELASGHGFSFQWDGTGPRARCLRVQGDPGLDDIRFDYRPEQYLTRVTDNGGGARTYHYDTAGRITARQDPDGGVYQWTYNARGQVILQRRPDGRATETHYDVQGRPERITLPDGREHCRRFDAMGRCVAEQRPDGHKLWYRYDGQGRPLAVGDQRGFRQQIRFDTEGRLSALESQGRWHHYAYDSLGRLQRHQRQDRITEYAYDGESDRLRSVHYAGESAPRRRPGPAYAHDAAGRLTRLTSAAGQLHGFAYDALGAPDHYRRPDGALVHYRYDAAGRLSAVIRPDGAAWRLRYDTSGRVSACQAPDGRDLHFNYDVLGAIIRREQPGDWVQHLERDAGGRVLRQHSEGRERSSVERRFQYDANGRLTDAHSADRDLGWNHDDAGQITSHRQARWEVCYEHGPDRLDLHLPDGTVVGYRCEGPGGQWQTLSLNGIKALRRTFDSQGREKGRHTDANRQSLLWDRDDRLVRQRWHGQKTYTRRHDWDADSRLEGVTEQGDAGPRQDQAFARDDQGQLTGDGDRTYAYDPGGNRQAPGDHVHLDRLLETADSQREYDPLGAEIRVTCARAETRRFDAEGQLVEWQSGEIHLRYGYDALGRRAWRDGPDGRVTYLWDGDVLLGEHRNGAWQWYLRDPKTGAPLLTLIDGQPYYYELDWRQAPLRLWSREGDCVWRAHADAWGQCHPEGTVHQPLRLPGQFADELSGLHFNRFRDYDPQTGRYLTPDPLGIRGGLNSYRYTPNPVDYVDPLGLDFTPAVTAANADQGELAPIPETVPAMQELPPDPNPTSRWLKGAALLAAVGGEMAGIPLLATAGLGAMLSYGLGDYLAASPAYIPESVKAAGRAAGLAYNMESRNNHFDGFREIGFDENGMDEAGLGLPKELFEDAESGFYAKLFKNTASDEYLIAFKGTNMTSGRDWANNILQGLGAESEQYNRAMRLAQRAQKKIEMGGGTLSFAGHSLGGGQASAAAAVTRLRATTFNAAGLVDATVERYTRTQDLPNLYEKVDAYYLKGDLLSVLQDTLPLAEAAGQRIAVNPAALRDPFTLHGMAAVRKALKF